MMAAEAGADFIGMILWQKAKRAVKLDRAKEIVEAAKRHGAQPVGVFVDEDATTIASVCSAIGLGLAQLHGEEARKAVSGLPPSIDTIYVMQCDEHGRLQSAAPPTAGGSAAFQTQRCEASIIETCRSPAADGDCKSSWVGRPSIRTLCVWLSM